MSDEFQGTPPTPEPPLAAPPAPPAPPVAPPSGDVPNETGKILVALGYPTGITALIALLMEDYKNDRFVKFHAIQAIGFWVAVVILNIAVSILATLSAGILGLLWFLIGPAVFVVAIIAAIKAWNGEYWEMPLVYGFVKQYIK